MSKLQKSGEEIWFVVYQNLVVAPLLVKPRNDLFLNDPYSFFVLCLYFHQTLRARVAAKTEEKKLELLYLRWSEHHKKLCNFIRCVFLR